MFKGVNTCSTFFSSLHVNDTMSSLPYLVGNISTINRAVTSLTENQSPSSIVCPVASATLAAYTNDIYMDHDRLPPMKSFTFGSETVNGHDLNGDFVYICRYQYGQGTFHLIGDSGLFTIGFATLAVTPEVPEIGVEVTRPDWSTYTFTLNNCEQRSVFLAKGDFFRMFCTLPADAENHQLNGTMSNFIITRVSKNTKYTHPMNNVT